MLRKKFKFSPPFHSRTKPIMCKIARQEDVVCRLLCQLFGPVVVRTKSGGAAATGEAAMTLSSMRRLRIANESEADGS